jgi:catechol 2,3-dioxygenase-like lactoylglutathione lyase family enzyme
MDPAKSSEPSSAAPPDDQGSRGPWCGIDHVQVAIPPGGEPAARRFYADLLGLTERPKPEALAPRGGMWFESGRTRVHIGVEPAFVPARKAHPALLVAGLRAFVSRTGLEVAWSAEIPGTVRCHLHDPFGNRIELVEADAGEDAR